MEYTRSNTLALASLECIKCRGFGMVAGPRGKTAPCSCVFRKAFRIVWNRFEYGRMEQMVRGARSIVNVAGLGKRAQRQPGGFTFVLENFLSDVVLVSKRVLSAEDFRLLERVYLSGVDWKRAHEAVGMARIPFKYRCNKLEAQLGRAFIECEPFSLLPEQYFSRPAPGTRTKALPGKVPARCRVPLVPPLAPRQPLKLPKAA